MDHLIAISQAMHASEVGDFESARKILEEARLHCDDTAHSAQLQLAACTVDAQSGDLRGAEQQLELCILVADRAGATPVKLEAMVTRASVLGALGELDRGIGILSTAIHALKETDLEELLEDARTELKGLRNLKSQYTAATFESLLQR